MINCMINCMFRRNACSPQVAARFPDKDEQLVIGCMSGMRSAKAVETLQACTAK